MVLAGHFPYPVYDKILIPPANAQNRGVSAKEYFLLLPDEEILRPRSVEVTEMLIIIDTYVRAKRVLGAIEVEVAVGAVGIRGGMADEVAAEAVVHPYAQVVTVAQISAASNTNSLCFIIIFIFSFS